MKCFLKVLYMSISSKDSLVKILTLPRLAIHIW